MVFDYPLFRRDAEGEFVVENLFNTALHANARIVFAVQCNGLAKSFDGIGIILVERLSNINCVPSDIRLELLRRVERNECNLVTDICNFMYY